MLLRPHRVTTHCRALLLLLLVSVAGAAFAGGRELNPRPPAPTTYFAVEPTVAFAAGRFLTVWREHMGELGVHVRGVFNDANGRRVSPVAFNVPTNTAPRWMELVGTGESFALFWQDGDDAVRLTRIDGEGRVTSERTLELPRHDPPRIAWNGERFLYSLPNIR